MLSLLWCQTVPLTGFTWEQTHSQNNPDVLLRQTGSCIYYTINSAGSDDISFDTLKEVVDTSFATWEDVDCSYFRFVETAPSAVDEVTFHPNKGNLNLLVWREAKIDWPFSRAAVAMTTVQHDPNSGVIYDTDIEFNGAWFTFGTNPSYPAVTSMTDLENTLTHEIGHIVGLDHSGDPAATMYADSESGEIKKRSLADDDIDGLCTLYPLDDDPEECREPYCGLGLDGEDTCYGVSNGDDGDCSCGAVGRSYRPTGFVRFLLQIFFGIHS